MQKTIGSLLLMMSVSCWGSGFYIGGGVGPEWADFNEYAKITHAGDLNANNTVHKAGKGYFVSLYAGYSSLFQLPWINYPYLYLAEEVNANASSLEFQTNNDEFVHLAFASTRFKLPYNFGISLLPGFVFLYDTLFYARIGYVLSHFQVTTSDTSLLNIETNLDGIRYGLGMSRMIGPHVRIRFEYSQANYQNYTSTAYVAVTKKTVYQPSTGQFELGLVYDFA